MMQVCDTTPLGAWDAYTKLRDKNQSLLAAPPHLQSYYSRSRCTAFRDSPIVGDSHLTASCTANTD